MTPEIVSILLVDDDDVEREAVIRGLRGNKLTNPIVTARDGIEALEVLRGENGRDRLPRPYVVLLDLNMPRMDGLQCLQAIRADSELEDSVVFILTTSKGEVDRHLTYMSHVAGYMVKSDVGPSFSKMADMLGFYWAAVELPTGLGTPP